ncbi:MAG: isochorismatase family protein [Roseiflexaceae bacterium]
MAAGDRLEASRDQTPRWSDQLVGGRGDLTKERGQWRVLLHDSRDVLLEKPRFGAFHAAHLELLLRARGIDTLIITGIATNVFCETTAREARFATFGSSFSAMERRALRHRRALNLNNLAIEVWPVVY